VAGAVLAGFLDGIMVVAGALDDAGVAALAPFVQVPGVRDAGHDAGQDALALVRGESLAVAAELTGVFPVTKKTSVVPLVMVHIRCGSIRDI
jgi:hypothetical protein